MFSGDQGNAHDDSHGRTDRDADVDAEYVNHIDRFYLEVVNNASRQRIEITNMNLRARRQSIQGKVSF